jgi:hypothetical protein
MRPWLLWNTETATEPDLWCQCGRPADYYKIFSPSAPDGFSWTHYEGYCEDCLWSEYKRDCNGYDDVPFETHLKENGIHGL